MCERCVAQDWKCTHTPNHIFGKQILCHFYIITNNNDASVATAPLLHAGTGTAAAAADDGGGTDEGGRVCEVAGLGFKKSDEKRKNSVR